MSTTSDKEGSRALLAVIAPHWMAEVYVYNYLYEEVASNWGHIVTSLPQGMYEVSVTLGGEEQRRLILLRAGQEILLGREEWTLPIRTAAPLRGSATTLDIHAEQARKWSREVTWGNRERVGSSLFIFARTLEPERHRLEPGNLLLLNGEGETLADFSDGVIGDPGDGWWTFNCNLPPGPYMLHTVEPSRYQPVWLSPEYETHIFLPVSDTLSLRDMAVSMPPLGEGFDPEDDDLISAELLLESMQRGGRFTRSCARYSLKYVFRARRNAWPVILASHVVGSFNDPEFKRQFYGRYGRPDELRTRAVILNHPDMRAAALKDREFLYASHTFPPMLRENLKLVWERAQNSYETIPPGCMTDRVLDTLIADGPWSAWSRITPPPQAETSSTVAGTARLSPEGVRFVEARHEAQQDRDLLHLARSLSAFGEAPEAVLLPGRNWESVLGSIEPTDISAGCGLPLGRVQDALRLLRAEPALLMWPEGLPPLTRAVAAYVRDAGRGGENYTDEETAPPPPLDELSRRLEAISADFGRLSRLSGQWAKELPRDGEAEAAIIEAVSSLLPRVFKLDLLEDLVASTRRGDKSSLAGITQERELIANALRVITLEWSRVLHVAADAANLIDDAILITNAENRVRAATPAFASFVGLRGDAATGQGGGHAREFWADGYPRALVNELSDMSVGASRVTLPAYPDLVFNEVDLLKVAVMGQGGAGIVAFLYILRTALHRPLDRRALRKFDELVEGITTDQILLEYGAPSQRPSCLRALEQGIDQVLPTLRSAYRQG